jgi:hypothetical protein
MLRENIGNSGFFFWNTRIFRIFEVFLEFLGNF